MTYHRRQCLVEHAGTFEIERLLHHLPTVAQSAENDWAEGFAKSITRQARRKGWKPSQKQLSIMRRLVADLFAHGSNVGGDFEVIE